MKNWYRNSLYTIHNADSLTWLASQPRNSFQAVVTDPPFSMVEYSPKELEKRRRGRGGVWRLPNASGGFVRQPMPRFTTLTEHDRMGVFAFHLRLAPELYRVLVPGAHVMLATQCLVSHLVAQAFTMAGFESRGQIIRLVKTLRGGDRPKFGHTKHRDVSVIPRSCFEPWMLFRKPCDGTVVQNLKRYGTGALRRPSEHEPFLDLIEVAPARGTERTIAKHPSLKPQSLMRALVRASLPLGEGIVLDPFMGSGSTIAAAKHLGLSSVGIEVDAKYFSMARAAIPKLAGLAVSSDVRPRTAESDRRGPIRIALPTTIAARRRSSPRSRPSP